MKASKALNNPQKQGKIIKNEGKENINLWK